MPRLREHVTTNDLRRSYRFWGGPIAFQGNWQDPTFHGHPTLNYNYGSFDGCSYVPCYTATLTLSPAFLKKLVTLSWTEASLARRQLKQSTSTTASSSCRLCQNN